MTRREQVQAIFDGETPAVPPVSIRLDLWHRDAVSRGALPVELAGCSAEMVEDRLGFCRAARWRARPRLVFPEGWVEQRDEGDTQITTYRFPGGALRKRKLTDAGHRQAGMQGMTVDYPVADESECRSFLAALTEARVEADIAGFEDFNHTTGDTGLPMLLLGSCPAHALLLEWFGYEQGFYALADYPDVLDELIRTLEELYRRDLWTPALESSAELILHGNHLGDATTPPPLFRKYFLPYLANFIVRAHAAGKFVLWHADAAMGSLLEAVLEAGFDGADCLATAPLVRETLEDYNRVWQGRIVCWGGLPGIVFNPEFPEAAFRDHVRRLRDVTLGRPGFIIGASDNVMPGACWERIVAVRHAFPAADAGCGL